MRRASLTAIAAVLMASAVACNRAQKSGPEAALDRAYQAGIITKSEYDEKRALLATAPAPAAPAAPVQAPAPAPAPPREAVAAPVPAKRVALPAATPAPAKSGSRPARADRPGQEKVAQAPVEPPAVPANPPAARTVPARPAPSAHEEEAAEPAPDRPRGCAETEIRPGKEKGRQERFYAASAPQVRSALVKALQELEFNVHKSTDTEIEASKKRHIGFVGSGGERMTLVLLEASEGNRRGTRVIGETKKGFVMRAGQKSWTNAVLDQTGCMLHGAAQTNP
jgi:hypothetical protein